MAAKARGREGKGGISPRALAASESGEAPGPGAERAAWSGDLKVAGSRPPTGAVLPRGGARFDAKGLSLKDFEAAVLSAASRLLSREAGTSATLRPSDVAEELAERKKNDATLWTAIEDVLLRYPELDGWRLARVEKKANSLVYLRYERAAVQCPLCGKTVRRHSAHAHAFAHLEKLERAGIVQLARENGSWVVRRGGAKYIGAGWRTLILVAEKLAREGEVVASG
jgi:hypothetical protein